MDETPKPTVDPTVFDPKRWVAAIVGGVVLGEALWAMLQILIRDWAMPALTNLMGQGPTRNQDAFELQPLFIAFVEACLAGILLVIILATTRSKTRVVRVRRAIPPLPQEKKAVSTSMQRETAEALALDLLPTERSAPSVPVDTAQRQDNPPLPSYPPPEPTPTPGPMATAVFEEPAPPASLVTDRPKPTVAEQAKPQPKPPAKPKKPKPVYYNIVGEPIESDEE